LIALDFLRFWLQAGDAHGLHSPFVFDLYTRVIQADDPYYAFAEIEKIRDLMHFSQRSIQVIDLGAGPRVQSGHVRLLKDMVDRSAKPARQCRLLFRLINAFKPTVLFELGTSLGITTLYLASPYASTQVITFEGCPQTAAVARENFGHLGLSNIEIITGNLDDTLAQAVKQANKLDFVFFDANHRYKPTIAYFETCLSKADEGSLFVFDDIYWSDEMKKAWQDICSHPQVRLSIDLFHLGLIFFRKAHFQKEHYKLRF
jgi:predicted O-methyltransferase YrrM